MLVCRICPSAAVQLCGGSSAGCAVVRSARRAPLCLLFRVTSTGHVWGHLPGQVHTRCPLACVSVWVVRSPAVCRYRLSSVPTLTEPRAVPLAGNGHRSRSAHYLTIPHRENLRDPSAAPRALGSGAPVPLPPRSARLPWGATHSNAVAATRCRGDPGEPGRSAPLDCPGSARAVLALGPLRRPPGSTLARLRGRLYSASLPSGGEVCGLRWSLY